LLFGTTLEMGILSSYANRTGNLLIEDAFNGNYA